MFGFCLQPCFLERLEAVVELVGLALEEVTHGPWEVLRRCQGGRDEGNLGRGRISTLRWGWQPGR